MSEILATPKVGTGALLIVGQHTGVLESVPFVTKQHSDLAVVEVDRQSTECLVRHDHNCMQRLIRSTRG